MRAVILTDHEFIHAERAMLARLEIGLADEGVRVIQAVPAGTLDPGQGALYSVTVPYYTAALPFTRAARVGLLIDALAEAAGAPPPGEPPADLVHVIAFHKPAADFAARLASGLGAALLIEAFSAAHARWGARIAARRSTRGEPTGLIAAGDALATFARDRVHAEVQRSREQLVPPPVFSAPWGVHTPPTLRAFDGGRTRAAAFAMLVEHGSAGASAAVAAFAGLAEVLKRLDGGLVFIGTRAGAPLPRELWRAARAMGVLDRLSLVPEFEGAREPILHADVLLLPGAGVREGGQEGGRTPRRTLMLDAMAEGVAVIAAHDPLNDDLLDGRTAAVVRPARAGEPAPPSAWARTIAGVIDDPARTAAMLASAQAFVREHRTAAAQVAGVLDSYSKILSPRPAAAPA